MKSTEHITYNGSMATLRCPTCKKPVPEPGEGEPMGAFPFCSDRCRVIDLGRWIDGKYQIPVVDNEGDEPADEIPPRGNR